MTLFTFLPGTIPYDGGYMTDDPRAGGVFDDGKAEIVAEESGVPTDDSTVSEETGVASVPTEGTGETLILAEEPAEPRPAKAASAPRHSVDVAPRRRSRIRIPRLGRKTVIALSVLLLLALSGVAYATYSYDRSYDGKILPGITVGGVDVGGMTRGEALDAVEAASRTQLDRAIDVSWKERHWTVTPRKLGAKSNAEQLVQTALNVSSETNVLQRARMAVLGDELDYQRDLAITYPHQGVRGFVEGVASSLDRDPIDASLDYSTGWVKVAPAREGRTVNTKKSRRALNHALRRETNEITLAVRTIEPKVLEDHFSKVLLLHIGENRLYLYENGKITHTYVVATGQPTYPTPTGLYEVVEKRYMPTWVNPDPTGWGSTMPASIPPGPGNPLGTRAINWSASGIRFHGTEATYSLGYNASHGCVRMAMPDVEELYDLIDVGTPIVSVAFGSLNPQTTTSTVDPTPVGGSN
jgi:lipoprotein-anchoring transpeptidase ErfK/SrfK